MREIVPAHYLCICTLDFSHILSKPSIDFSHISILCIMVKKNVWFSNWRRSESIIGSWVLTQIQQIVQWNTKSTQNTPKRKNYQSICVSVCLCDEFWGVCGRSRFYFILFLHGLAEKLHTHSFLKLKEPKIGIYQNRFLGSLRERSLGTLKTHLGDYDWSRLIILDHNWS